MAANRVLDLGTCVCYEVDGNARAQMYTANSLRTLRRMREEGVIREGQVFVLTPGEIGADARRSLDDAFGGGLRIEDCAGEIRTWRERAHGFGDTGTRWNPDTLMLRVMYPVLNALDGFGKVIHLDGDTEVRDARFAELAGFLDGYCDCAGVVEGELAAGRFRRCLFGCPATIPPFPALTNVAYGRYVNSGVIAVDAERLRRTSYDTTLREMCDAVNVGRMAFPDQDAINLFYAIRDVPCAFNAFWGTGWKEGDPCYVRHFAGSRETEKPALNRSLCPTIPV